MKEKKHYKKFDGKEVKVIYNEGNPVDLEYVHTKDIITIVDYAKSKGKKVLDRYSSADDILTELEDINPVHNEDGNKSNKISKAARKKLIRAKMAERNADIRMKALNKFFE